MTPRRMRLLRVLLALVIFAQLVAAPAGRAQEDSPHTQAAALLERLTPEERVGQLLLFNFKGQDTAQGSPIYDLIVRYHIGGVILSTANDNFGEGPEAAQQIISMNRQVQLNRWVISQQQVISPTAGLNFIPAFIPLFIGLSQQGDGAPYDQILSGLTPLPSQMALGATWNPDLARQAGDLQGRELSALGVNLLFGPDLDVLETTAPGAGSGLGARTFGGDPFWVARMGQAYITGLHEGSAGRLAVAARNFPGIGAADRVAEEEVATVRKSLEQLQVFDLAPFFEVTGNAPDTLATADALLASHIRYQGFQGNIRATTRPVSFDQQAFNLLMSLPPLTAWRDNGGVMISDDLGSRAVRRFYELTNPDQAFDARRVALNAFLAGNDLLYLGDITSSDDLDAATTAAKIAQFFAQKYREDPAFAGRVDESVLRILRLKYRLYGSFTLNNTIPAAETPADPRSGSLLTFEIARQAATLISPSASELDGALPEPPNRNERIVFITDTRMARQCSTCAETPTLGVDALKQAVLGLYGPQAAGQVTPSFLYSYSYADLIALLDGDPDAFALERDLRRSAWVVFAMLDVSESVPDSAALDRFLAERLDLFQQKKLVVFSFNAPYYLDATNISKLTAYYGLYSKSPAFIDVAARILFRELRPSGSLPVSVPGAGYDLFTATTPDPAQVIPLQLDLPDPGETPTQTLATPAPQVFQSGDLINVRTGVILDRNGHPVPDGTQVQFIASTNGEVTGLPLAVSTVDGVAHATLQAAGSGALEIRAEAEPAKISDVLRFEIPAPDGAAPTPTVTLEPTATPTHTPEPSPTPPPVVAAGPAPEARPHLFDWIVALLLAFGAAVVSYRILAGMGHVRRGVHSAFLAFIGGMIVYSLLSLDSATMQAYLETYSGWGVVAATLLGSLLGLLAAWLWHALLGRQAGN